MKECGYKAKSNNDKEDLKKNIKLRIYQKIINSKLAYIRVRFINQKKFLNVRTYVMTLKKIYDPLFKSIFLGNAWGCE